MTKASTVLKKITFSKISHLKALGSKFDLDVKYVKVNLGSSFRLGKHYNPNATYQSKKEGKDQESIQSSTTPDPGYQWESDNAIIRHHKQEPRSVLSQQVTTRHQQTDKSQGHWPSGSREDF